MAAMLCLTMTHDAQLHQRLRKRRLGRQGKSFHPVHTGDRDIFHAPGLQIRQDFTQNFDPSLFGDPQPRLVDGSFGHAVGVCVRPGAGLWL